MENEKISKILRNRGLDISLRGTHALAWCIQYAMNGGGSVTYKAWMSLCEYSDMTHTAADVVWRRVQLTLTAAGLQMSPIEAIEHFAALCKLEGLRYES